MLSRKKLTFDELKFQRKTFSQFGEDLVLSSLLGYEKSDGFFVDVGAFDPISLSNTYLFSSRGWKGINIEPNPEQFRQFPVNRPRDINLNLAISESEGHVQFCCNGVFSGIESDDYKFHGQNDEATTVEVLAQPLSKILEEHVPELQEIDFLSVDCEGHDLVVLKSSDWARFRPKVVVVEDHGDRIEGPVFSFMADQGYTFHSEIGLTQFHLREDLAAIHLPTPVRSH